MTEPAAHPTAEELLEHSAWVWRLARSLAADEHQADDLAQDTWLAALQRPPRLGEGGSSLRGWLAVVARNLAIGGQRADRRRAERERDRARSGPDASVERLAEREEARQQLGVAVTSLAEPLRTAIILRYFEELAPTEIARHLDVPASTVRSRIQRGLGELRRRLAARRGEEWRSWCLAMLPVGAGLRPAAMLGGLARVVTMGTSAKVALAACALGAGALLVWQPWNAGGGDRGPTLVRSEGSSSDATLAGATASPSPTLPVGVEPGARRPVDPVAGSEEPDPLGLLVVGTVRSADGGPVESGLVTLQSETGRRHRASIGPHSAYAVTGLGPGAWLLHCDAAGFRDLSRAITVEPGEEITRHDLVLEPAVQLKIKFLSAAGEPLPMGVPPGLRQYDARLMAVATIDPPGRELPETLSRDLDDYGIGQYLGNEFFFQHAEDLVPPGYTGILTLQEPLPAYVSAVFRHLVLETRLVPPGAEEVVFQLEEDAIASRLASARIRVVDAVTSEPVAGASVCLNHGSRHGGGRRSGEDGVAVLEQVLPGPLRLEVGSKGYEVIHRLVRLEAGRETDLGTLTLARSCRISGRVVDQEGNPQQVSLSWLPLHRFDPALWPAAFEHGHWTSQPDGLFELTGVGRGTILVLISPYEDQWALEPFLVDTSNGDAEGVILELRPGQPVGVDFAVSRPGSYQWTLSDAQGRPLVWGALTRSRRTGLRLAGGTYAIEIREGGRRLHAQTFEVGGEPMRVEVSF